MNRSQRAKEGATARIGSGTRVRGRIAGEGSLDVEGRVEGDVSLDGALLVADGGEVVATSLEVSELRVDGSVRGDVRAQGDISVSASGSLVGDVHGASFSMEEGAHFEGALDNEFELPAELLELAGERRKR